MDKILFESHPSKLSKSVSDFSNFSLKGCRPFAKIIGLWPAYFRVSPIQKIIKYINNCICYFTLGFVLISSILVVSVVLKDFEDRILLTGPLNFLIICLTKYTLLMCRSDKIEKCVQCIHEDWQKIENEEQQNAMIKNAKFGYYLIIISATFMYSGGFWFNILSPFIAESIVTDVNITIKPYPAPVYGTIFTNGCSPIYEIIFTLHLISGFVQCTITVTTFSIAAVLTTHACGQLQIVILYLHDLVRGDKQKGKSLQDRLTTTVNYHLKALRFISYSEDLLSEICLIEVFGCTLNMCLLGYYIITVNNFTLIMTYSLLFSSFIFNIFIYCYIGQLLTTQAAKVGDHAYMIEWYLLPNRICLDMIFMIQISHNPAKLTAGKIIDLSMNTFSTVIRSSAAYLNVLWRMTQ